MLIFALALAAPTPLTQTHQRDISCVVEIAVLADGQKRGVAGGADVQASGKRWAAVVGERVMLETGQPRELVSFAMIEAAKARAARNADNYLVKCVDQMTTELAGAAQPILRIEISKIDFLKATDNDRMVVVEGAVINEEASNQMVPRLRMEVKDAQNRVIFTWLTKPVASTIEARQKIGFKEAKLGVPESATSLTVSFVELSIDAADLPKPVKAQ